MNEQIKNKMMDIVIGYLIEEQLLSEIMTETTVRITKKANFSRRAGAAVGSLAKNDPMYKKMQKLRDQYKKLKGQLKKKYAAKAKALAKQRSKQQARHH